MKAIILCYHKVGPETEVGRWLSVHPDRLRQFAAFFRRRGYTFVRGADLASPWPSRCVCFTFDDAYISALDCAVPILKSFGGTGSFYAVPKFVGLSSEWDGDRAQDLASWDSLRLAQSEGFEIGNHTFSHVHLGELSAAEISAEIISAHDALVAHELRPGSFCYPYGSESALARAGCIYPVGLRLGKAVASESDDRRGLPRVVVAYGDSLAMLLYKIHVRPRLRQRERR
jgi:peptidoglycan/xylan/chitin deacetylase (PgdA/CDA1 family)